jgi:ABC-type glucose/galactose transport system permease subunit
MVELCSEPEDLGHSKSAEDWEQTEHNEKKNNDPINIQKVYLKMLKGLNPCNAFSTLFATFSGWIMGSLLFWISKISLGKAIKSVLKSIWDQTCCRYNMAQVHGNQILANVAIPEVCAPATVMR